MKITASIKVVMLGAMLSLVSHTAAAISTSDVTLDGSNADSAKLTSGNDSAATINTLFPTGWSGLLKTDGSSTGSFMGIDFTMTGGTPGSTSGNFTLSWLADPASLLPKTVDLVFTLKAGNGYAAYFFDDEVLTNESGNDPGTGSSDGTWAITFTNNGGQIPDLSHLSLYIRSGSPTTPEDPIPVPGTLLLLGLGLMGLKFTRRKTA